MEIGKGIRSAALASAILVGCGNGDTEPELQTNIPVDELSDRSENIDKSVLGDIGYDLDTSLEETIEFMKRAIEGDESVAMFPVVTALYELEVDGETKTVGFTGAVIMPSQDGLRMSPYLFCIQPEGPIPMPIDEVYLVLPPEAEGLHVPTETLRIEENGDVYVDDTLTGQSFENTCDVFDGTVEQASQAITDGTWPLASA